MSKGGKRDKPYKHFDANYWSWHYCWGGHYLKQDEKFATNRAFRRAQKKEIENGLSDYDLDCHESLDEECDRLYDEDLDMSAFWDCNNEPPDRYGGDELRQFWERLWNDGDGNTEECIEIKDAMTLRTLDGELVYLKYDNGMDSGYYRVNGDSLIRDAPCGKLCVKKIGSVFNDNVQILRIR